MDGSAVHQHCIGECFDDANGIDASCNANGQALAAELINKGHETYALSVMGLSFYEAKAPEMIGMLGPQPDARSIIEPKP